MYIYIIIIIIIIIIISSEMSFVLCFVKQTDRISITLKGYMFSFLHRGTKRDHLGLLPRRKHGWRGIRHVRVALRK